MKQYGNRRSDEELRAVTEQLNALSYVLEEQPDFWGTQEELVAMQNLERYYIDGYPKVSDEEWEVLKRRHNYRESLVSIAPSGREWIRMQSPLPSIEKAATLDEMSNFLSRFEGDVDFLVEPKLDGLTANMVYELDEQLNCYVLKCITSRGNGRYGLKLHPHALDGVQLHGVPQRIPRLTVERIFESLVEHPPVDQDEIDGLKIFELRGEAVVERDLKIQRELKTFNEEQVWASVISGIFNRKVPANLPGLVQFALGKSVQAMHGKAVPEMDPSGAKIYVEVEQPLDCKSIFSLVENYGHPELGGPERFGRRDRLFLDKTNQCQFHVLRANGEHGVYTVPDEHVYVVSYSCSVNGLNYDAEGVDKIPGVLHVSELRMMDPESGKWIPTPFVAKTSDKGKILQMIADFYGVDVKTGKRDMNMHRYRNMHAFALDGIVVKLARSTKETQGLSVRNARTGANRLVVPKYPLDQIACKLESEIVKVKLQSIEKTTTSLGNVTCQGVLDHPYQVERGAFVERINLHNINWLQVNNWIHEGGEYEMVMAMDIIPVLLPPDGWVPGQESV